MTNPTTRPPGAVGDERLREALGALMERLIYKRCPLCGQPNPERVGADCEICARTAADLVKARAALSDPPEQQERRSEIQEIADADLGEPDPVEPKSEVVLEHWDITPLCRLEPGRIDLVLDRLRKVYEVQVERDDTATLILSIARRQP